MSMKQATVNLPSGTYLIQEVPEDADYFDILEQTKIYRKSVNKLSDSEIGNWQLLGADPTALTEEEAGEIVESLTVQVEIPQRAAGFGWYTKFKNYQSHNQFSNSFWIPTASLNSLAASLGIEKPFVVLKNKNDDNT